MKYVFTLVAVLLIGCGKEYGSVESCDKSFEVIDTKVKTLTVGISTESEILTLFGPSSRQINESITIDDYTVSTSDYCGSYRFYIKNDTFINFTESKDYLVQNL